MEKCSYIYRHLLNIPEYKLNYFFLYTWYDAEKIYNTHVILLLAY